MGNVLGSIVDTLLVRGLLLFEQFVPLPDRLGAPLPAAARAAGGRDPVVLIGGFANAKSGWDEWRRTLEADGFEVYVFDPPTYGLGDMEESARAVAAFLEDVRRRTGRRRVDVIGFSEGGILSRMAVAQLGQLGGVDRLISLASPHRGIELGGLWHAVAGVLAPVRWATPEALVQLFAGSELLRRIERDDEQLRMRGRAADPRAPRYASIFSRSHDMVVSPASSWLPGALNIPVQANSRRSAGPTHFEMFHMNHRAYEAARILLLDGDERAAAAVGLDSLRQG